MISYKVTKSNREYKIETKGHADYADIGYDIVCASVSSMLIFSINLIEKLGLNSCNITKPICEEGHSLIHINRESDIADKILDNLKESLDMLAMTYPKNIKSDK